MEDLRDRSLDASDLETDYLTSDDEEVVRNRVHSDNDQVDVERGTPAAIARKRSLQRTSFSKTSAERKRARLAHGASTALKNVLPSQRVQEFPGEHLVADGSKLVCRVCHTEISLKMSVLKLHLLSERHKRSKAAYQAELDRQQLVRESFQAYKKRHNKDGSGPSQLAGTGLTDSVPEDVSVRRIETVLAFMKAGVPLKKVDHLRPLLEVNNSALTDSSHLRTYVPFILEEEDKMLQQELSSACAISVIFDGSTHLGEALAIVARFVDQNWDIQQRLIRFHVLAQSLNGQQLAGEIIQCLSVAFRIPASKFVAAIRDGAAVNGAALRSVKEIMFPRVFDILCASHSLDNVGRHFNTPLLDNFGQWWVGLFARSPAARIAWKARTGVAIKTYSSTRWWSYWEVLDQLMAYFGEVEPFVRALDVSPTCRGNLLGVLDNAESLVELKMQLAVTIDAGRIFVSKTYLLEGDGDIVVDAYGHLQEVATAAADVLYPNAKALAQQLTNSEAEATRLFHDAKAFSRPALQYFQARFNHQESDLFRVVAAYKAVRVFCPKRARQLRPTAASLEELRRIPILDDDATIRALQDELPAYLVAAEDVVACESRLKWWQDHEELPRWQAAARVIFSMSPSSAAAERVFSLLQAAVSSRQESMLEDQIEAMVKLQFNRGRKAL